LKRCLARMPVNCNSFGKSSHLGKCMVPFNEIAAPKLPFDWSGHVWRRGGLQALRTAHPYRPVAMEPSTGGLPICCRLWHAPRLLRMRRQAQINDVASAVWRSSRVVCNPAHAFVASRGARVPRGATRTPLLVAS
jgi:hypothetical protein